MDIINFFCKDLQHLILSYVEPDKTKYNNVLKELEQLIIYSFYTTEEEDEDICDFLMVAQHENKFILEFSDIQNLKCILNVQLLNRTYTIKECIKHVYNRRLIKVPNYKGFFNRYKISVYGNIEEADIDDLYYLNSRIY